MLELLKQYTYKQTELLKLEAMDKSVNIISFLTFLAFAAFLVLFFLMLFFIGIGLVIGHYLGNYGTGILLVAGISLIVIILIFALRKKIKVKIANLIIKSIGD